MAEEKIKHSDLIEDQVFEPTIEQGERLLNTIKLLEAGFKGNLKASQDFFKKAVPKNSKELDEFAKQIKLVTDNEKGLLEIQKKRADLDKILETIQRERLKTEQQVAIRDKEKIKTEQELVKQINLETKAEKEQEKLRQERLRTGALEEKQRITKIAQDQKKIDQEEKEIGTINRAISANARLRREVRGLELGTKEGRKRKAELNAEINRNSKIIDVNSDKLIRQKINIGNYTASIKDALKNTGLFNNGIGRLVITLNNLRQSQDEAGKSTKNLSNIMKIGLLGIAAIAVGGLIELAKVNQSLLDIKDIGLAKLKDAAVNGNPFETFARATIEFRKELRLLQIELQKATLDEQDFNQIAADTTIGFKERQEALKEAIRLSNERAGIAVTVAQKELDLANQEISAREAAVGVGNATNDLLDKRLQATLKLNEAIDVQGDLERQNAQREREQNIERAINEIDLLLKKKQSAKADKVILETKLADERRQLEERRKINEELLNVNRKTTAEEIKLFKQFVKVQFDENELLRTTDAVLLKQRLESIRTLEGKGLGESAIVELAKIVKQAQEDQIANAKTIVKLNEEELIRKQKIASIEREIAQIELNDRLGDTEKLLEDRINAFEEANAKIFKGDNLFNKELREQRQREFDFEIGLIIEAAELKRQQFIKNAEDEIQNIKDSVFDEKIKAEEIKKINVQLQVDLGNIQDDAARREREANKLKLAEDKKLNDALIENAYQRLKAISDGVSQGLAEGSKKKQEAIDMDIELNQSAIERQEELAQEGSENQLAFEEKQRAKLQAQLAREKEAEQRREEALQLANVFLEFLKERAKSEPNSAPARALADTLIARAISRQIAGAFAEGVEDFQGKGTGTSDSNLIAFSDGESVVTAKATDENPGLVTAMNKGMVNEYIREKFNADNVLIPHQNKQSVETGIITMLNKRILSLENTVKNKKEIEINWNEYGQRVETVIENGMKEIRRYVSTGKNRL